MTSIASSNGSLSLSYESLQPDVSSNASFDGREVEITGPLPGRPESIKSRGSLDDIELPEEVIRAEGLRHADIVLNAK